MTGTDCMTHRVASVNNKINVFDVHVPSVYEGVLKLFLIFTSPQMFFFFMCQNTVIMLLYIELLIN